MTACGTHLFRYNTTTLLVAFLDPQRNFLLDKLSTQIPVVASLLTHSVSWALFFCLCVYTPKVQQLIFHQTKADNCVQEQERIP